MNGKTIVMGLFLLLLGVGAGYYFNANYKLMPAKTTVTTTTTTSVVTSPTSSIQQYPASPAPTVDESAAVITAVKAHEVARIGAGANASDYSVTKIVGGYAQGMVSASGGGAIWYAAKVNGAWKVVFVGNGSVQCTDLTNYPNFPNTMITECWDNANQKVVVR